jgi:anti-sigma regulatory factor (Ser/Thr protein kinase)
MRTLDRPRTQGTFRHEALLYTGTAGFSTALAPVVRAAVEGGDAVLVVAGRAKVEALRAALGDAAAGASFADMAEIGGNPARIIPAWQAFLDEHRGRTVLGVGEPIYAARSAAELVECQRHEALLNVAFDERAWRLVCPYDTESLSEDVIAEARRSHPWCQNDGVDERSTHYDPYGIANAHQDDPLPEPPRVILELTFGPDRMALLRRLVAGHATRFGLAATRRDDLVVSVAEVAANSVRHGGGGGFLRLWREAKALVCEISDRGVIGDPLAGRRKPPTDAEAGRGLWMANQLCDLVQIRTNQSGTVVRLHVTIDTD